MLCVTVLYDAMMAAMLSHKNLMWREKKNLTGAT
jgi:hypothetical protein